MPATRFVTDASLDLVARRLRFLGFDVVTHRGARLEELFAEAARDGRTVLTTSRRHPRRFAPVSARVVPLGDAAAAVRAVAATFEPSGRPWSRCPRCNVALRTRSAFEARGEVPGRVARSGGPFADCPACGQWYWPGSHVVRLRNWLEAATGRPVPPPGPPPAAGAGEPFGP